LLSVYLSDGMEQGESPVHADFECLSVKARQVYVAEQASS